MTALRLSQQPGIQVQAVATRFDIFTPEDVVALKVFQKRGKPYLNPTPRYRRPEGDASTTPQLIPP